MLSWFFHSLSQLFLHVHQQVLLIPPSKYTKEPTSLHLHHHRPGQATRPPVWRQLPLSSCTMLSLYQPRMTQTEHRHSHLQPSSDPLLCSECKHFWAELTGLLGPCPVPSSPPTTSHLLLPLAPCAHTAPTALSLPKLTPILGISSLLLPQPEMLLPLPAGWLLPVIQSSDSRLPYSERPVLTGHTQSNQPTVPCTALCLLLLGYLLQLECKVWDLLWVLTQVWHKCHNSPRCVLKTCVLYCKLYYWGIIYE